VHEQHPIAVDLRLGRPLHRVNPHVVDVERMGTPDVGTRQSCIHCPAFAHSEQSSDVRFTPGDDRPHPPGPVPNWAETWGFGFARLCRMPHQGVAWWWTVLRSDDLGIVVVRDDEVPLPRRDDSLELRGDGIWVDLTCETPLEHWSIGLEAFGLRVDDVNDDIGERLPVGLDLEWEITGTTDPEALADGTGYTQSGVLHGELLVGNERIAYDAPCTRDHSWGEIKLPGWPPVGAPD
jgi:hypothetical protein